MAVPQAAEVEAALAKMVLADIEANPQAALDIIAKVEGTAEAAALKLVQNFHPGGFAGVLYASLLESKAEQYAQALVAQFGPPVVLAFVEKELQLAGA